MLPHDADYDIESKPHVNTSTFFYYLADWSNGFTYRQPEGIYQDGESAPERRCRRGHPWQCKLHHYFKNISDTIRSNSNDLIVSKEIIQRGVQDIVDIDIDICGW